MGSIIGVWDLAGMPGVMMKKSSSMCIIFSYGKANQVCESDLEGLPDVHTLCDSQTSSLNHHCLQISSCVLLMFTSQLQNVAMTTECKKARDMMEVKAILQRESASIRKNTTCSQHSHVTSKPLRAPQITLPVTQADRVAEVGRVFPGKRGLAWHQNQSPNSLRFRNPSPHSTTTLPHTFLPYSNSPSREQACALVRRKINTTIRSWTSLLRDTY